MDNTTFPEFLDRDALVHTSNICKLTCNHQVIYYDYLPILSSTVMHPKSTGAMRFLSQATNPNSPELCDVSLS